MISPVKVHQRRWCLCLCTPYCAGVLISVKQVRTADDVQVDVSAQPVDLATMLMASACVTQDGTALTAVSHAQMDRTVVAVSTPVSVGMELHVITSLGCVCVHRAT
eukprot:scpid59060/ scgid5477/ 